MVGTSAAAAHRFADADVDEAVDQLVAVIAELRPHVVVTYDPDGGYGHPDHIQAHRVTTAAVDRRGAPLAGARSSTGPWCRRAHSAPRSATSGTTMWNPTGSGCPVMSTSAFPMTGSPPSSTHPSSLPAKVDAIAAHATQTVPGPTGRAFTLSNKMILPVLAEEHYVLVSGRPGPVDERGWETDLLAGIDLGAE